MTHKTHQMHHQAALASKDTSLQALEAEVVGVRTELDTARLQVGG